MCRTLTRRMARRVMKLQRNRHIRPHYLSTDLSEYHLEPRECRGGVEMKVEVVIGNIANQPDVETLVNSANGNLRLGSGVAGAIHTAAGRELEAAKVDAAAARAEAKKSAAEASELRGKVAALEAKSKKAGE